LTRIKGTNVHIGDNFVLPIEKKVDSPEEAKLKEELRLLECEIKQYELQKAELIESGKKQAEEIVTQANAKIQAENEMIAKQREEEKKAFDESIAQEAEKIKAEAYQTGYDDGYKQGYVVITNELENKIHAVDDFAKSQFELKNNIVKSSELDIIELVVEIAKKVCTKSLELNPEIVKLLTANAIKELKDKEDITIIVNPKLMDVINSISNRLKEEIPQLQNIKILEDNNVSADGTIVESVLSRVDSRVKSQINEIADKLFEAYNSEDKEFEDFMLSLEEPDISDIQNIELSDDTNIEAFLNELEDIPSYEDKLRDEDAQYYDNLDIEELKRADIEQAQTDIGQSEINEQDLNISAINLDEFEEIFENNDVSVNLPRAEMIDDELPESMQNFSDVENEITNIPEKEVTRPVFEKFDNLEDEILEENNAKQNSEVVENDTMDLNPEEFLTENPILPELEEQKQNSPVNDEEISGEDDAQ